MQIPLVSIVIPVFNGSNYLGDAIDSALAQTYKNIEVIVVNDGSTDNTEEIAKSYGDKIRYFAKENGGVASALNLGLKEMKGEYFSWLSHDDIYCPKKIEQQIRYLTSLDEKNIILYSDYIVINEYSEIVETIIKDGKMLAKKPEYALLRGAINGCTMLIPKKAFNEYGFFDEKLRCAQDYAKWFEMMKTYRFVHIPKLLAKYRLHQGQDSNKSPEVLVEGNNLWIEMIKNLSLDVKERLEGSEWDFLKQMVFFLKKTPYKKAAEFTENKINEMNPDIIWRIKNYFYGICISFFYISRTALTEYRSNGFKGLVLSVKRFLRRIMR